MVLKDFQGGLEIKNLPANAGDMGLIPGSGRSPREGNGNPHQYPCLRNLMDRAAWPCLFNLHADYIMQNARLELRLLGEMSTTSDMQMIDTSLITVVLFAVGVWKTERLLFFTVEFNSQFQGSKTQLRTNTTWLHFN